LDLVGGALTEEWTRGSRAPLPYYSLYVVPLCWILHLMLVTHASEYYSSCTSSPEFHIRPPPPAAHHGRSRKHTLTQRIPTWPPLIGASRPPHHHRRRQPEHRWRSRPSCTTPPSTSFPGGLLPIHSYTVRSRSDGLD
jgi:hypothetical protein